MANRTFAALTGHDEAIQETARMTEKKIELDEETIERLNDRLRVLQEHMKEQPEVSITYFVPDIRKTGGVYITKTGILHRVDEYEQTIVMQDKSIIMIDDILIIEGELFHNANDYE